MRGASWEIYLGILGHSHEQLNVVKHRLECATTKRSPSWTWTSYFPKLVGGWPVSNACYSITPKKRYCAFRLACLLFAKTPTAISYAMVNILNQEMKKTRYFHPLRVMLQNPPQGTNLANHEHRACGGDVATLHFSGPQFRGTTNSQSCVVASCRS